MNRFWMVIGIVVALLYGTGCKERRIKTSDRTKEVEKVAELFDAMSKQKRNKSERDDRRDNKSSHRDAAPNIPLNDIPLNNDADPPKNAQNADPISDRENRKSG